MTRGGRRRATIPDIAQRANASTATVDRVLISRAGVSNANRQRVLCAANDLGYLPVEDQIVLPARRSRLEFFLPRSTQTFFGEVKVAIETFAATLPLVSSVSVHELDNLDPRTLEAAVNELSVETLGVGIVAVDHPLTRQIIRDLDRSNVKVITLASDLLSTHRAAHVGLNDRVAGRTASLAMGRFVRRAAGTVALFIGDPAFHGQRERELGFHLVMETDFPGLTILPAIATKSDSALSARITRGLLEEHDDLVGIYCMGGGRSGIASVIEELPPARRPCVIMHDLSEPIRRYLAKGVIDLIIDQNAKLFGEQSVIRLLGTIAATEPFLPEHYIEPRLIMRENIPAP
ncbi:LacI family DNA-binding transcriptional regulator [Roseisalinus antarcticus]|uniref:HTH-type transcriptional repressor CytR n=1 Tax=Roseisalinus antarcticus TaxID=254357 RepID=A0A1Y5TE54_9RHOB|nr:LacI family DNA-binding transcriptional regulator [Roseisalinus antarcticus]SLN61623.1 HTH-type transcriptional repressor CytR [Roseisalinus antarcticus]